LKPEKISEPTNPSFVCRRQEQPGFTATIKMQFNPENDNEEAGIVIERDCKSYFRFCLGAEKGKFKIRLHQQNPENQQTVMMAEKMIKEDIVYLRITSAGINYSFCYSLNGTTWIPLKENINARFLGGNGLGRFTGTFIGLYASSNGIKSKNYADFDWFEYENNNFN
jgi:alpha-N-arabinofuranosidase